jgi:hypothetical protein
MIRDDVNSIQEQAVETVEVKEAADPGWNIAQRIAFGFAFCYFGLYICNMLANTTTSLIP